MHPWMPFITEEIWHLIKDRNEKDCIIIANWPVIEKQDKSLLSQFEIVREIITVMRNIRQQKQISPKEKLKLIEKSDASRSIFDALVIKLANLSAFEYTNQKIDGASSFMIQSTEFFVPLSGNINKDEERARIMKELEYSKGFLKSVQVKLANEKFVAN